MWTYCKNRLKQLKLCISNYVELHRLLWAIRKARPKCPFVAEYYNINPNDLESEERCRRLNFSKKLLENWTHIDDPYFGSTDQTLISIYPTKRGINRLSFTSWMKWLVRGIIAIIAFSSSVVAAIYGVLAYYK